MTDPDAPYLHLAIARAKRAVLRAQVRLATSELSEHVCHTQLNRLKVRHFKKALAAANASVGQWCDSIRHTGRPLYSSRVVSRPTLRRRHLNPSSPRKQYVPFIVEMYKLIINRDLIQCPSGIGNDEFYVDLR